MALIPNLQNLDIQGLQQKSMEDEKENLATAVAEKQNPMAHHLLMRIKMKDMPKVNLFMDVGSNWNNTEYIASFLLAWKDEVHFVATNAAAILFHKHGDIGLSFFPKQVWCAVQSKGWNDIEDHPVTTMEEQLNAALKPFDKDLNILKMFEFSKMKDTSMKSDLQNASSCPMRADHTAKNPQAAEAQVAANHDAFSMTSQAQLQYYNKNYPKSANG
jgi:hypothetical protein